MNIFPAIIVTLSITAVFFIVKGREGMVNNGFILAASLFLLMVPLLILP